MKGVLLKLWQGVKDSIIWIIIQYAIILCLELIHMGYLYVWSLFSDYSLRDLAIMHQLGGHNLYNWLTALVFAIPTYTVIFSFWHVFFNKKEQWWTNVFPLAIYLGVAYLNVAKGLDWNYKLITVDEYLLFSWLAPLYGAFLQGIVILLRKKEKEQ